VAWLSNAQPQTTQPYAAFIGALTRSGIEPTELRVRKSWMDLDSEWETWTSNLRGPTGDEGIWDYSLVTFNQVTDLAQLGVRWLHGHASGFGLRPARSLGIAILLVLIIWTVLRLYHGRVAFLSVPKKELDEPNPTEARLLIFKKHSTEWRVISLPVVVRMMIPHALTSVPLLGSMFSGATFNWSENSIVGFRRADKVDKDERISKEGVPAQSSTRWKSITPEQEELKVELPHKAPPLSYLKIRLETGREQIRQLSAARRTVDEPKTTPSAENPDPVHEYLPGLIAMPQSGRLLATLRRWSRIGLVATAILVSGLIALFRF
jgi:hypothetical protein